MAVRREVEVIAKNMYPREFLLEFRTVRDGITKPFHHWLSCERSDDMREVFLRLRCGHSGTWTTAEDGTFLLYFESLGLHMVLSSEQLR